MRLKIPSGQLLESILKGKMNNHLGYESNDKKKRKILTNRRNGYGQKTAKASTGEADIQVPRDRDGSFDSKLVPKS